MLLRLFFRIVMRFFDFGSKRQSVEIVPHLSSLSRPYDVIISWNFLSVKFHNNGINDINMLDLWNAIWYSTKEILFKFWNMMTLKEGHFCGKKFKNK